MKKISIVLTLILSAFIISSCAEKNPNDPNTDNSKKITLAERVGNYTGDMNGQPLSIEFNDQGHVVSVQLGGSPLEAEYPIVVGEPSSTNKEYTFSVKWRGIIVNVKVIFDSDTEATGGNAYVGIGTEPNMNNPIKVNKI